MITKNHPNYSITKYKSCNGMEGLAFSGILVRLSDGKAIEVAEVNDAGNGGELRIRSLNKAELDVFHLYVKNLALKWTEGPFIGEPISGPEDIVIEEIIERIEIEKRCKKYILFSLKGDALDSYREIKVPKDSTHARIIALIHNKYGDTVEQIINELFS